jgi:hypothetical protein
MRGSDSPNPIPKAGGQKMHDVTFIAFPLVAVATYALLTHVCRGIERLVLARRMRRSVRLAVRGELGRGAGHGSVGSRARRPLPGTGGEDMAA